MATELLDLTHELEMARAPIHFQTQNFQFQAELLLYLMLQAHGGLQVRKANLVLSNFWN